MDGLEGVIGLVWLMFLVGSVLRAVVQGKRRAEQEAARRAMRRAQGQPNVSGPIRTGQPQAPAPPRRVPTQGKQVLRPGWPVYPGQPAQPVVVVEQGEGEGESVEGGDTLQPGMWGAQEDDYSTEGDGRDIRRRLKQEQSEEWRSDRARTWEMPADAGSLGAPGEVVDEPFARSADAFGVNTDWEMLDEALDEDMDAEAGEDVAAALRLDDDAGLWQLPGRVEPEHALAGIVWGTVLGMPRCRLTRHGR